MGQRRDDRETVVTVVTVTPDQVRQQEEHGRHTGTVKQVKQTGRKQLFVIAGEGRQQYPHGHNHHIGSQCPQAGRAQHTNTAKRQCDQRRRPEPSHDCVIGWRRLIQTENHQKDPHHGVKTHFGHDGEQRSHRRTGSGISPWQPEQ